MNEISSEVNEISSEVNEISSEVNEISSEVNEIRSEVNEITSEVNFSNFQGPIGLWNRACDRATAQRLVMGWILSCCESVYCGLWVHRAAAKAPIFAHFSVSLLIGQS